MSLLWKIQAAIIGTRNVKHNKNDKLGETAWLRAEALALTRLLHPFWYPCSKVMSNHPYFQQTFVFKVNSHQILKLVLLLCINMKTFCSVSVYYDCLMQFTCVVVWGDGRKEVWPGDAFWVMTIWVCRMTWPWLEAGGWCIKTAITTSLDCKQMYCCTLGPPEAKFVLDVSLICQAQSIKCNSPTSSIRAFLRLWLRCG